MSGGHVVGPGDDDRVRLVLSTDITKNSAMKLETGEVVTVYNLDVVSRSLGSPDEVETHSLGFAAHQLAHLAEQLIEAMRRA